MSLDLRLGTLFCVLISSTGFIAGDLLINAEHSAGRQQSQAAIPLPARASDVGALEERLEAIQRLASIEANQIETWMHFSKTMIQIRNQMREHNRRLAAGESFDASADRVYHTLMFGAAMNEIDERLRPEQAAIVHSQVSSLAAGLICADLSRSR